MEKSALQLLRGYWHLSASCRAAPDTGSSKSPKRSHRKQEEQELGTVRHSLVAEKNSAGEIF